MTILPAEKKRWPWTPAIIGSAILGAVIGALQAWLGEVPPDMFAVAVVSSAARTAIGWLLLVIVRNLIVVKRV